MTDLPILSRWGISPVGRGIFPLAATFVFALRVAAIFLLPNYDGDAYCYLEKAAELRAAILSGTFRPGDLFYFWLPLYPLATALASLALPGVSLMLVGKLVSAAAGVAVCFFVWRLVLALTDRPIVAALGALLVALDPWQVLYSANTMTEMLFEALVLGAVERLVAQKWNTASLLLAAAGLIRIEAWVLALMAPVAAFLVERRLRWSLVAAVLLAPLLWGAISLAATGHALAYFSTRDGYVRAFLSSEPTRTRLSQAAFANDLDNFLRGGNLVFVLGAFCAVAGMLVVYLTRSRLGRPRGLTTAMAPGGAYLLLLGFLLAAYLSRSQPVLWVRYGLIYQPLGVCLTLWWVAEGLRPTVWRWVAVPLLLWGTAVHTLRETEAVMHAGRNFALHRQAAARLAALDPACAYCDSPVIRVESGLPRARLRDRFQMRADADGFLEDLRQQKVDCLVLVPLVGSPPVQLFPGLLDFQDDARGFEPVARFAGGDWRPTVLIYRFKPTAPPLAVAR